MPADDFRFCIDGILTSLSTEDAATLLMASGSFLHLPNAPNTTSEPMGLEIDLEKAEGGVRARFTWFRVAIPIICALGIVGNILNLLVLTRRHLLAKMDGIERSANYGLVALACSDLMFCLSVLPHGFVAPETYALHKVRLFDVYFRLYGNAAINLFLVTSTWLIVTLALSRYVVVVYPLQARYKLTVRKTIGAIAASLIGSLACTLPHFLLNIVDTCRAENGFTIYVIRSIKNDMVFLRLQFYIRWVWPVLAHFIPFIILLFCNFRLIRELRNAKTRMRTNAPHHHARVTSHRVTLTLAIIVLMLLLLVSPCEIIRYIDPYASWGPAGHVIAAIANVLQACNFAFNFVLYCVVNDRFRRATYILICACAHRGRRQSEETEETKENVLSSIPLEGFDSTCHPD